MLAYGDGGYLEDDIGKLPGNDLSGAVNAEGHGKGVDGYDDIYLFIPVMGQIVRIAEGAGDNLLPEDIRDGYVDYIYYEQYGLGAGMPGVDGGQVLLDRPLRERYCCMAECIPDVLDMAYGDDMVGHIILR